MKDKILFIKDGESRFMFLASQVESLFSPDKEDQKFTITFKSGKSITFERLSKEYRYELIGMIMKFIMGEDYVEPPAKVRDFNNLKQDGGK